MGPKTGAGGACPFLSNLCTYLIFQLLQGHLYLIFHVLRLLQILQLLRLLQLHAFRRHGHRDGLTRLLENALLVRLGAEGLLHSHDFLFGAIFALLHLLYMLLILLHIFNFAL